MKKNSVASYITFCTYRFVWITAGKNCFRVRYCGRSHSPYTLDCSHGTSTQCENRTRASMMKTAVRGIKGRADQLWTRSANSPALDHRPDWDSGLLHSRNQQHPEQSNTDPLWSLICLYYTTNFGQAFGDIGLP